MSIKNLSLYIYDFFLNENKNNLENCVQFQNSYCETGIFCNHQILLNFTHLDFLMWVIIGNLWCRLYTNFNISKLFLDKNKQGEYSAIYVFLVFNYTNKILFYQMYYISKFDNYYKGPNNQIPIYFSNVFHIQSFIFIGKKTNIKLRLFEVGYRSTLCQKRWCWQ